MVPIDLYQLALAIRAMLAIAWDKDTAYDGDKEQAAPNSPFGQCYVSALVTYLLLEENGFDPHLVWGRVGQCTNHYWLEIEGRILDLTADQFKDLNLPPVVWGAYEDYPMYERQKEDTGFARFLRLAWRCGVAFDVPEIDA